MSASENVLNRIRGEYLEMPGLRLTPAQAARLWALDRDTAGALLSALADTGFLVRAGDGQYARRGDSEWPDRNDWSRTKTEWPDRNDWSRTKTEWAGRKIA